MTFAEQAANVPALGSDIMLVQEGTYDLRWKAPGGGMTTLEQRAREAKLIRVDGPWLYFDLGGARLGPLYAGWLLEARPC